MSRGSGGDWAGRSPLQAFAGTDRTVPFGPDLVLVFVAGLLALAGAATVRATAPGQHPSVILFEAFMYVGLAVAVLLGTAYLRRSDLPQSTWWHVVSGYLGGIAFIWVLLLWATLPELTGLASVVALREEVVLFGNLGGVFGFVLGVSRARAEYNERLREDLETSHDLVESAGEALWMYSVDPPSVLFVNAAYERLFGQSRSEMADDPTTYLEAIHPDDRETVREHKRRLFEGESVEYEIRVDPGEEYGRRVWVTEQPVYRDGERYAFAGYARDVTDRKRRQRRFEAIFNQTYQFTGLLDTDGTLLEANDAALEFGGVDREDVVGEKVWDAHWFRTSEETRRRTREDVERAAAGEFVRHDLEVQGADGTAIIDFSIRPVTDEDGEVSLLIPEGRDITDIKRYEQRLIHLHDATRELYRATSPEEAAEVATETAREVLGLPVNTVALYDPDERVLDPVASTREARELFGPIPSLAAGESLAWDAFESGTASVYDDVSDVEGRFNEATRMRSELILPLEDHGVFLAGSTEPDVFDPQLVSLARLFATNLASALSSIDRQRELEARRRELEARRRELEARRRELEHQNERLDEFAGIVSHDLRNPLTVAKGNVDVLEDEHDQRCVEQARGALDRMDDLIDDLLELSRAGDRIDDCRPVELSRLAEESWRTVETDGADLRVSTDLTVVADEGRLAQLLENLYGNAVEHGTAATPSATSRGRCTDGGEGGSVEVTVGSLPDGFYVADDGPGIPPEDREQVFDPGVSSHPDGNGFGLSIVQQIAEAHGWDVSVTESSDGGARFEVTGVEQG